MNREPVRQLWFDFAQAEYDLFHANSTSDDPTQEVQILERALNCENMFKALARVEHNAGCPGIDGMTVEELRGHLREVWPHVRQSLLDGILKVGWVILASPKREVCLRNLIPGFVVVFAVTFGNNGDAVDTKSFANVV